MSSEAHSHHSESATPPQTAGKASPWFVLILVGLFIAAVNFVNVMGHDAEEDHTIAPQATEEAKTIHPTPEISNTNNTGAGVQESTSTPAAAGTESDSAEKTH